MAVAADLEIGDDWFKLRADQLAQLDRFHTWLHAATRDAKGHEAPLHLHGRCMTQAPSQASIANCGFVKAGYVGIRGQ